MRKQIQNFFLKQKEERKKTKARRRLMWENNELFNEEIIWDVWSIIIFKINFEQSSMIGSLIWQEC